MPYSTVVCLVGENPLPIYLGIRHYATLDTQVVLIQTGDSGTRKQAAALAAKIIKDKVAEGKSEADARRFVVIHPDIGAYNPQDIIRAVRRYSASGNALLNYTGGTKIMSSFSLLAWYKNASDREELPEVKDAVYLEEESGGFRHADGKLEKLALPRPLTLDDVVDIHKPEPHLHYTHVDHSIQDLRTLFSLRKIYYTTPDKTDIMAKAFDRITGWQFKSEESEYNTIAGNFDPQTALVKIPSQWHTFVTSVLEPNTQKAWLATKLPADRNTYKNFGDTSNIVDSDLAAQVGFARAKWLEHYVYNLLLSLGQDGRFVFGKTSPKPLLAPNNIYSEQQFLLGSHLFESDVVALYNNRLRYISVTTSRNPGEVKSKLFEAIHRARQIGGGMASSCVLSLLPSRRCNSLWLSTGGDTRHSIFGSDETNRWERGAVTADFKDWLTE